MQYTAELANYHMYTHYFAIWLVEQDSGAESLQVFTCYQHFSSPPCF